MVSKVTEYICVDRELHVNSFCKGSLFPLPQWFHMVGGVVLHARVLENFPVYLSYKLKRSNLVVERRKRKTEEDSQNDKICTIFRVHLYLFIQNFARRFPFPVIIVIGKD